MARVIAAQKKPQSADKTQQQALDGRGATSPGVDLFQPIQLHLSVRRQASEGRAFS